MNTEPLNAELTERLSQASQLIKEGAFDEAIPCLKSILEQRPTHDLTLGMLASIYLQLNMCERAIQLFETLLQAHPDNPLARLQLGIAKFNSGAAEEALTIWEPMLATDNDFMAHFHSAVAHAQLGRLEEAIQLLDHTREHMPTDHPSYPQLLDLHAELSSRVTH